MKNEKNVTPLVVEQGKQNSGDFLLFAFGDFADGSYDSRLVDGLDLINGVETVVYSARFG